MEEKKVLQTAWDFLLTSAAHSKVGCGASQLPIILQPVSQGLRDAGSRELGESTWTESSCALCFPILRPEDVRKLPNENHPRVGGRYAL